MHYNAGFIQNQVKRLRHRRNTPYTPQLMLAYTSIAVFLFSALSLVIASGFSLGAVLLLLGSLALLRPGARRVPMDRQDWLLIGAFVLYFVVSVANNLALHARLPEYDAPLRFVLVLPALLLLRAYPPRPGALWGGLAVGAVGASILSLWQLLALHIARPSGSTNPIQYGNISTVLAILCACGLWWAARQPRARAWTALMTLGMVSGASASLVSGSRGSWMAVPACLLLAAFPVLRAGGVRLLLKAVAGCVVIAGLLWLVPQTGLRARIELAMSQANQYETQDINNTSIAARIEMLRLGLRMAPQHPWLGWGKQAMVDYKSQQVDEGRAPESIREHTHLHNEYLDALVKHGIFGLLATLVLFGAPLLMFARRIGGHGPGAIYALAGAMLMLSYLAFGLTQAFLTHNNGVMVLAFMAAILWSCARADTAARQSY